MQDNPNTDSQTRHELLNSEDWALALEPYEGKPSAALDLGYNLAILRNELDGMLIKSRPVIDALDLGLKVLFHYTDFHDTSFELFIRLMEGKLTRDEEQMLNALGIEF